MNPTKSMGFLFVTWFFAVGSAHAALPAMPEIPVALPDVVRGPLIAKRYPLAQRKQALIDEGEAMNRECARVEERSALHQDCLARQARFNTRAEVLRREMDKLSDEIDAAIEAEIKRLQAEDRDLTKKIGVTLNAIGRIGFDRRAQDYEAWIKMSEASQKEFEDTIKKEATGLFADKIKDKMLESFQGFDKDKGDRLIAWLRANARKHGSPVPIETIDVIRRVSHFEPKGKLVQDAKFLVKVIERTVKSMDVKDFQEGLPILLDSICDLAPEDPLKTQCKLFRATSKVTVAALYNNATRRVAIREVERLNQMAEQDLKTLQNYNEILKKFITKRNEDREKIKALEQL